MNTVIFSGTTEGRKLSEMLCAAGINHHVCVATAYGRGVMEESSYVKVHEGRMDSEAMIGFLKDLGFGEGDMIVDATHPYASEVTDNISRAAQTLCCSLIRIRRDAGMSDIKYSYVNKYETMKDFACTADRLSGNILLTTGSKDLEKYCSSVLPQTLARTYVRVLPSQESIGICTDLGISPANIIAMQGPFSMEMNRVIMREYAIEHMLTKDGGTCGGFEEKTEAAANEGVSVHILTRPENHNDHGISVSNAYERITGSSYEPCRHIVLVGIGPGSSSVMTHEADRAIRAADAVFGSKRVIEAARSAGLVTTGVVHEMYLAGEIIKYLDEEVDITNIAVLFSGDTGFYSGAKKAYSEFTAWDPKAGITVIPGISSVSYLASGLGVSYDDADIISVHGNNGLHNIYTLASRVRYNSKTFALLSDSSDLNRTAKMLADLGIEAKVCVGRNLSYGSERSVLSERPERSERSEVSENCLNVEDPAVCEEIRVLDLSEAENYTADGSITVLFINDDPQKRKLIARLSDDDLLRGSVPMTKECVRHESIGRLELCEGDIVYDIGGGTGSVALEIASIDPTLSVTTIEEDHDACELIRKNREKLGLFNVSVVEGDAVDVLPDLPCPDCVFIGGSGGKLRKIVQVLTQKGSPVRFVITAVSLETISEVQSIMDETGAGEQRAVQLAVSNIRSAGSHHLMQAQNPVTIFSFTI